MVTEFVDLKVTQYIILLNIEATRKKCQANQYAQPHTINMQNEYPIFNNLLTAEFGEKHAKIQTITLDSTSTS
uniref:Uncharacterized protein n=1 Tax=Physcomitrium patens TaxID=3218 RepID=A0A2K1JL21_PHYPA|nr:hypothetical protein PHYPA_017093 [Physcomitrium patens]